MFEIIDIPISNNKNKDYLKKYKYIAYLCSFIALLALCIWYIFYSDSIKIYRVSKVSPILYKL